MTIYIPTLDEMFRDAYTQESLVTADGHTIIARFFEPSASPVGSVLIVGAMGVPQTYYEALAVWLQKKGYFVATFDYRGIGLSRKRPLNKVEADILVWARQDCEAALTALLSRAPSVPMVWLGHSLGGQILPFVPSRARVSRMITIGSGNGYWRKNTQELKRVVWLMWYVITPLLTPVFGYFPGARLNMVGDLPKGVVEQWRKWCLHPDYAVGAEGPDVQALYDSVTQPVSILSFTDDEYMSAESTASLHAFYRSAPQEHRRLNPAELGIKRIGHFGFFRRAMADVLWEKYLLPEFKSGHLAR